MVVFSSCLALFFATTFTSGGAEDANLRGAISNVAVPEKEQDLGAMSSGNGCGRGFVGMLARQAPGCLEQCADIGVCPAVGKAIGAYMRRRNLNDVKTSVCAHQQPFECLLSGDHAKKCEVIFQKAKAFGLPLPSNTDELTAQCGAHVKAVKEEDPSALLGASLDAMISESEVEQDLGAMSSGNGCGRGFVGMLARQAPGCLEQCADIGVCPAVDKAIGAYMRRRNLNDVKTSVCAHQQPFECLLSGDHAKKC